MFFELYATYDLLNRILTFGLDRGWRRSASLDVARTSSGRVLDLCSGTGDMAISLRKRLPQDRMIVAADFCLPMLHRAVKKAASPRIVFVVADAAALPFKPSVFGAATISFATRNLNSSAEHLCTCFRSVAGVLQPGGVLINIETSQPGWGLLKKLYHAYVGAFVKPVGTLLSGSRTGYTYLSNSIPRFFSAEELTAILQRCGFGDTGFRRLFGGIIALHHAVRGP
jgi:demethylmenaquinone methyltransferase / 2-methoxy-6-polyprenyl-1,4-benzoquinol methylase